MSFANIVASSKLNYVRGKLEKVLARARTENFIAKIIIKTLSSEHATIPIFVFFRPSKRTFTLGDCCEKCAIFSVDT